MGNVQLLTERLSVWAIIAASAGVLVPISTDALSTAHGAYMSDLVGVGQLEFAMPATSVGPVAAIATASIDEQIAAYREASKEAKIAIRILNGIGGQIGLPEVNDYTSSISALLATTSEGLSFEEAKHMSSWLKSLRGQLVDQASSFKSWLRVAELINPDGGPHPVPSRFVRREVPVENMGWGDDLASDARVRRSMATLLGDNADPASGAA